MSAFGLRKGIAACLFDLDGVLTPTARIHAEAWKRTFDRLLASRRGQARFDPIRDYDEYVDGKPREDGVRSFLESRGIRLDEAQVHDLAARKDHAFLELLHTHGVAPYPGSLRYLEAVRRAGLKTAVVSASKHATEVLRSARLDAFDAQVDGVVTEAEHLRGKPAPDTYLAAARKLGLEAGGCAVFEDALAGVEAGRAGRFGEVVGVDRVGQAQALKAHGADVVVHDLSDLLAPA